MPKLNFSCPERWENMRVGVVGRHCFNCDKTVVDFTGKTRAELITYLKNNSGRSVCGRVRLDQIDAYHEFVEICIWRSLQTKRTSNLAFYLLAIGGVAVSGCGSPEAVEQVTGPGINTISSSDTLTERSNLDADGGSSLRQQTTEPDRNQVPVDFPLFVGDVILDEDSTYGRDHVHQLPEIFPEFPGGQDSLFSFMRKHVAYPEWEADNNIAGKVYVEFEVEKDGTITDPRIRRTVQGSRNFDGEVLRVMKLMPRWSPGRNGSDVVKTKLVLPVVFSL